MATAKIMLTLPTGEIQHFEYSDMDAAIEAFILLAVRVPGAEVAMSLTLEASPCSEPVSRRPGSYPRRSGYSAAYQPHCRGGIQ